MWRFIAIVASVCAQQYPGPNGLSKTPPMGWMSWERFRCQTDCATHPAECINEKLYQQMASVMASEGYLDAGYHTVSIDDCWESKQRTSDGELQPDPERFPSGLKALGDYMHKLGVKFGIYSDMGTHTCGGYPGSEGYEEKDANTFASWGVDYLKLDGCYNNGPGYESGYPKMGMALQKTGRDIVYSCSWPAYLGDNETAKPFDRMILSGCNLWRNWHDINNEWSSVASIIKHWGDYSDTLAAATGPGHWNDPDMILVGDDHYNFTMTPDQSRAQMSIWSIMAAPLIMGNDLRTISAEQKAILLNKEVIAVDQDPMGKSGKRISQGQGEVWARPLANNKVAVVLYNPTSGGAGSDVCTWNVTAERYLDAGDAGNIACENWPGIKAAREECCDNPTCAGFSVSNEGATVTGCTKNKLIKGAGATWTEASGYDGWLKLTGPPSPAPLDVSFTFAEVGFAGKSAVVRDLWAQKDIGTISEKYSAQVPVQGVRMFTLTPVSV